MTLSPTSFSQGGNEVFFSFLQSLWRGVDRGLVSEDAFLAILRDWGLEIGRQARLSSSLKEVLSEISEILPVLGLVRFFGDLQPQGSSWKVLVLRCLFSLYIETPREQQNLRSASLLLPFLEGLLQAASCLATVSLSREGSSRPDEYTLLFSPA